MSEPSLIGGPTHIVQVMNNLVSNAIKLTDSENVDILVKITRQTDTIYALEFCVMDTGIGIPNHSIGTIFPAFTQTDDATACRFVGSGWDLKITKNLVEKCLDR